MSHNSFLNAIFSKLEGLLYISTLLCWIYQDAKEGTTTGVSAADRANTILALASPESKPGDFRRPGHIFPLKYILGGVLKRVAHKEASTDLETLVGFNDALMICEIVENYGSM